MVQTLIFLASLLSSVGVGTAGVPTYPITGHTVLVRPGVYRIQRDISAKNRDVILIRSDGVILDLEGHTIEQRHRSRKSAVIRVKKGSHVVIRNGTIRGGWCGICIHRSGGDVVLENLRFEHQEGVAVVVRTCHDHTQPIVLRNNSIHEAGYWGVVLDDTERVVLEENVLDSIGVYGILVNRSSDVRIKKNKVTVSNVGIMLKHARNSAILGNEVRMTSYSYYLYKSVGNELRDNLAGRTNVGVFRYQSPKNKVKGMRME